MIKDESSFGARDAPWFYSSDLRLGDYMTPFHSNSPHVFAQRHLVTKTVKSALALRKANCVDRATKAFLTDLEFLADRKVANATLRHRLLDIASIVAINVGFGMKWSAEEVRTRPEARAIVEATDRIFTLLTVRVSSWPKWTSTERSWQFMDEPTLAFPFLTTLLPFRTRRIRREAQEAAALLLGSHRSLYDLARAYVRNEGEDALEPSVVKSLLLEKGAGMTEFQHMCTSSSCDP